MSAPAQKLSFLEKAGYRVLRFWNHDMLENSEGVLQTIATALQAETHPPCPPASRGVNNFNLLLITNGATPDNPEAFERILDMFDGNDAQAVANARARWAAYKDAGHEISYMKQTENGGWSKAA